MKMFISFKIIYLNNLFNFSLFKYLYVFLILRFMTLAHNPIKFAVVIYITNIKNIWTVEVIVYGKWYCISKFLFKYYTEITFSLHVLFIIVLYYL